MNIRLTARIILLNNEDKCMLLKFVEPQRSFWLTPGGKIEEGETPFQAAQRELHEETGITSAEFVTPHSWYGEGISLLHGVPTFFKEHYFLARVYTSDVSSAYLNPDEKEIIKEYKWWDLAALMQCNEPLYPTGLVDILSPIVIKKIQPLGTTTIMY